MYIACKTGDIQSLSNLLAIFSVQNQSQMEPEKSGDQIRESCDQVNESCDKSQGSHDHSVSSFEQKPSENVLELTSNVGEVLGALKTLGSEKDESKENKTVAINLSIEADNKNSTCQGKDRITKDDNFGKDTSCNKKQGSEDIPKATEVSEEENLDNENTKRIVSDKNSQIICEKDVLVEKVNELDNLDQGYDDSALGSGDKIQITDNVIVKDSALPLNKLTVQVPGSLQDLSPVVTVGILSETFGDHETTLLHVAAREGHKDIVTVLMTAGADPAIRYGKISCSL